MPSFLNAMTRQIPSSSIHAATQKAEAYRREGKKVVIFSIGRPDFDTPQVIKDAAYDSIRRGNVFYTSNYGTPELRKAIAEKLKRDNNVDYTADEILVTIGVGEGTYAAVAAFLNPGDEVLVPDPVWLNYIHVPNFFGAVPVSYKLREENDFQIDLKELESLITDKTRMLVINTPGNPTGVVQSYETLKGLADIAIRHDLIVVSDEIYEKLVYDGAEHFSVASISQEVRDRTVTVNGFSKAYAMTGWRIGYAAARADVIKGIMAVQSQTTSATSAISQKAALAALQGSQHDMQVMVEEFKRRKDYVVQRLNAMEGIVCPDVKGAFYVYPDVQPYLGKRFGDKVIENAVDLCQYLLDEALISTVPGEAYNVPGKIRISYSNSMENLEKALDRMEQALKQLS